MRLWHYKLIPFLPDSQLVAQWRELNSIFKNQPKHILINYVYKYDKYDLLAYSNLVIAEMEKRNFKTNTSNYENYFDKLDVYCLLNKLDSKPFENHHNDRYLLQCFMNLQEKFDRGQQDFSKEQFIKMRNFVTRELYDSLTVHVVELLFLNE